MRHIERTRLLLHVIDVSASEGRDPVEDFYIINKELEKYSKKLAQRDVYKRQLFKHLSVFSDDDSFM